MISLWGVGTNPGQILNIWTGFYTVPVRLLCVKASAYKTVRPAQDKCK